MAIIPLQVRVNRNLRNRGVRVLSRRAWGTNHAWVYLRRLVTHRTKRGKKDTLWQHITVTFDSGPLRGDFKKDMQFVEKIGFDRFGSGFSYNYAVDMKTGMVGVGMPLKAKGTHTQNDKNIPGYSKDQNYVSFAVAFLGMPGDKPSDKAIWSVAKLYAALMDEGALTQDPDYEPHSLVAAKECPTQAVRDVMPLIETRAHKIKRRK